MTGAKVWAIHDVRDAIEDHGPTGCGYYRVVLPFDQLRANDWRAAYGPGVVPLHALDAKIITAQRVDRPDALGMWRRYRARSRLVYELDDDIWNVNLLNWNAFSYYTRSEHQDAVSHAAGVADLVTVTTEPLAEVVREMSGQENIVVIPNFIPAKMLAHERPRRERLTVGWGGGVSHAIDMLEMADPLRRFLDTDAPDAEFHIVGSDFRGMTGHRHARCSGWEPDPAKYYENLDFDIGLAPLAAEKFNESKSWIKVLEYAALGIPCIASDFGPYREFVVDGVTGFLVKSKAQWRDRLRELASDADLRESMGQKAREVAAQNTIEGNWQRWDEVYRRLL